MIEGLHKSSYIHFFKLFLYQDIFSNQDIKYICTSCLNTQESENTKPSVVLRGLLQPRANTPSSYRLFKKMEVATHMSAITVSRRS